MGYHWSLFLIIVLSSLLLVFRSVSILGKVCAATNHGIRMALWFVTCSSFTTLAQAFWSEKPPIEGLVAVMMSLCVLLFLDRRRSRQPKGVPENAGPDHA